MSGTVEVATNEMIDKRACDEIERERDGTDRMSRKLFDWFRIECHLLHYRRSKVFVCNRRRLVPLTNRRQDPNVVDSTPEAHLKQ
jgi:hypothetical protein